MTTQALISKIDCTLWANQTRDSELSQTPIAENAPKLFPTQVFQRNRKTKRTKLILQPSPSWEVNWRRHDHNTL